MLADDTSQADRLNMRRGPDGDDLGRVVVEKRKWDGTVSARWVARLVAGPPTVWCWRTDVGRIRQRPRLDALEVTQEELSLAGQDWWVLTALLGADGRIERMKADAAAPVTSEQDALLWFYDLDLDLQIDGHCARRRCPAAACPGDGVPRRGVPPRAPRSTA